MGKTVDGGIVAPDFWYKKLNRPNSNIVAFGSSGTGKSTSIKSIILNELVTTKVLVIDPEKEYVDIAKRLNGNVIDCSGKANEGMLNPLQIRVSDREDKQNNYLSMHFQFLQTFFQILFPTLTEIEFSMLDLILEELYKKFNITRDTDITQLENKDFPILEDLYFFIEEKNKKVKKKEYELLLSLIRPIAIGQFQNIWNGYTNININDSLTVFNTHDLQGFTERYKRAQYYNILSFTWEILSRDSREKTMLVVDECHTLITPDIPQTLEFLRNISKRARKYQSSIVVISQSPEDFMNSKIRLYGQSLIANSCYKLVFNSSNQDIKDLAEICGFSDSEKRIIANAKKGECLFLAGVKRIHMYFKLLSFEWDIIKDSGGL